MTSAKTPRARVKQTPVGLELPETLTEDQWQDVGRELGRDARASAFRIGDWLLHAEVVYDKGDKAEGRYVQAEELTGLGRRTLRNYASVCRRVPMSRRRDALTFGHHDAIASLDGDEQERLLTAAETGDWTLAKLRDEVQTTDLVLKGIPRSISTDWTAQARAADQPIWKWLHDQIECAKAQLEQAAELKAA